MSRSSAIGMGWAESYQRLVDFHRTNGHCIVTKRDDKNLAKWVSRQRGERKQYLTADRRRSLDALGFSWETGRDVRDESWEERFRELEKWWTSPNRSSRTPNHDTRLETWIVNQRKRQNRGALRDDRRKRLESIGFDFGEKRPSRQQRSGAAMEDRWNEMFERLEAYKKVKGDCCVPYAYKDDPTLGYWVSTQRRVYNQKSWYGSDRKMREDRVKKLDALGFEWDNLHTKKIRKPNAMDADVVEDLPKSNERKKLNKRSQEKNILGDVCDDDDQVEESNESVEKKQRRRRMCQTITMSTKKPVIIMDLTPTSKKRKTLATEEKNSLSDDDHDVGVDETDSNPAKSKKRKREKKGRCKEGNTLDLNNTGEETDGTNAIPKSTILKQKSTKEKNTLEDNDGDDVEETDSNVPKTKNRKYVKRGRSNKKNTSEDISSSKSTGLGSVISPMKKRKMIGSEVKNILDDDNDNDVDVEKGDGLCRATLKSSKSSRRDGESVVVVEENDDYVATTCEVASRSEDKIVEPPTITTTQEISKCNIEELVAMSQVAGTTNV